MYTIIGEQNKVRYGCIDESVNFNYQDYTLTDFFGKEIRGLRKRFAVHTFNYLGIITDEYLVGIAAVNLGYMQNVFAYVYDYTKGKVFETNIMAPPWGPLSFPVNPDEYEIHYEKGSSLLSIKKSHTQKTLVLDAHFSGRLSISGIFSYSLETHAPLRVLNPSEPSRWTFTEKCAPLIPSTLNITLDGVALPVNLERSTMLYDWSGGYLRRETNWYWAAFSGVSKDGSKTRLGLNLAALVNESFYSENAFWINNKRTRVSRAIYDFNPSDPYVPWHIFDEEGKIDIHFTPIGERAEKINACIIKTWFRQFVGEFAGTLKPDTGASVSFEGIHGFTELHRALW